MTQQTPENTKEAIRHAKKVIKDQEMSHALQLAYEKERTQTIGRGDAVCDFRLYRKER